MGNSLYTAGPLRQGSGEFMPSDEYWPLGAQAMRQTTADSITTVAFDIQFSSMEALKDTKARKTTKGAVSYRAVGCSLNVIDLPIPTTRTCSMDCF